MFDLSPTTTTRWFNLLPADFRAIMPAHVSMNTEHLDFIRELVSACPPGQRRVETFKTISWRLPNLTRAERIRVIAELSSDTSHVEYLAMLGFMQKCADDKMNLHCPVAQLILHELDLLAAVIAKRIKMAA